MSVTIKEFKKLENINIIDVRTVEEFNKGHLTNSINIPITELPFKYLKLLNDKKTYYIICQGGMRSANACMFLRKYGYNVVNVLGGYSVYYK